MIPKTIHLCWFSGEKYPPLIEKCVNSWREKMPDYQIRVWTYQDALNTNIRFVKEALRVKKWAFAADVIRLYALYHEGGVYLDSDFFVKSDPTPILTDGFVSAIESWPNVYDASMTDGAGNRKPECPTVKGISIQAAFLAAPKGHFFLKDLLDFYSNRPFIRPDGSYDMNLIAPEYYARAAEKYGFKYVDRTQFLEGITIYSSEYIASSLEYDSPTAYGIHGCAHSWVRDSLFFRKLRPLKRMVTNALKRLIHR
jgi:mannosyltransferase OCH1-like enzyme